MIWKLWPALGFALVFPTVTAWLYFVALPGAGAEENPTLQTAYALSKVVQFAWPVLCAFVIDRAVPLPGRPTTRGLAAAAAFGVAVNVGMLALYFGLLRNTPVFAEAAARLRRELSQFGLASPGGFALFAVFITLPHSLLEEYYWRWFVFGWLRRVVPVGTAVALSSLAFGAFHLVLLAEYLPGWFLSAAVPFGACTAAGAAAWAWIYHRSGSIYAPWLSHLIVDVGLFVIGHDLYFGQ
jgi:membrane protease YdiL (CAAX protease family)